MFVRDVGSIISVVVVVRAVGVLEAVALNFIISSRICLRKLPDRAQSFVFCSQIVTE